MKKIISSILLIACLWISLSSCSTKQPPATESARLPDVENQADADQDTPTAAPPPEAEQAPLVLPQPVPGPLRECIESAIGASTWHEIDTGKRQPSQGERDAITTCVDEEPPSPPEPPPGETVDAPEDAPQAPAPEVEEDPVPVGSAPNALAPFPETPLPVGELVTVENSFFQVTYYDKYAFYDDYQTTLIPVHVVDLAGNDNDFFIEITSEIPEGWEQVGAAGPVPTNQIPGEEGGDILVALPPFRSSQTQETTFTVEARSSQYQERLVFSFTVVAYPQLQAGQAEGNADATAMVEGLVTDAETGQPIQDAAVSLWLGPTTRIMPFDMLKATQDNGSYIQSVWDIDVVNDHYAPYTEMPGYVLMVQKAGYHTYIHENYLRPRSQMPLHLDISLVPLDEPVAYDLKWETPLWSPGVWEIEMNEAWDRFAVAMGKHPDHDDPDTLPTEIPLLDAEGRILWAKPLPDQSWAVDISTDGSLVACGTHAYNQGDSNYAYLWDADGSELWRKSPPTETLDIAISPDKQLVAFGPTESGLSLGLYNASSGAELWGLDTGFQKVRQVAFTPDGQHLLAGPVVHLIDTSGEIIWRRYEFSGLPYIIWTSPDMSRIMIPDKGDYISMYNGDGDLLWRRDLRVLTYGAMSADGSLVVALAHNGNLFAYSGEGELLWYRQIPVGDSAGGAGHNGIDITPDGRYIAVGGGNYTTLLYDAQGNLLWRHQGTAPIDQSEHPYLHSTMAVRISPDGTKIISGYGTSDPRICYFEMAPGQ